MTALASTPSRFSRPMSDIVTGTAAVGGRVAEGPLQGRWSRPHSPGERRRAGTRRTVGQGGAAIAAMGGLVFGFAFMVAVVAERLMHQHPSFISV